MKVGTGSKASLPGSILAERFPPEPSRTDRGDGDPVQTSVTSSTRATALIPSSRSIAQRPVPPLGGGAASAAGQDGGCLGGVGGVPHQQQPAGNPAWYPDIQPFDISTPDKVTPGYSDAHQNCGEIRFKILCPKNPKHHARFANYNCHRAACPICWPGWAGRASDDAVSRIEGYRMAHRSEYLPRHISIHPPEGLFEDSPEGLQQLYDAGRTMAGLLGLVAVAVIPHHDRLNPDTRDAVAAAAADAGMNRYEYALAQDNWFDLVKFSPHLHLVAYGPLMGSEDFEEKTGWTYRNHDGGAGAGRSGSDLRQTVYYLLTHAWVRGNHRIVRYWLGMSTHRLTCTDIGFELKTEPCPVCACDMVKTPPDVIWEDGSVHHFYQDLQNAPTHTIKVRLYQYTIRAKKSKPRTRAITQAALAIWGPAGPPVLS